MTRISDDPLVVLLGAARARVYAAVAGHGSGLPIRLDEMGAVAELHAYRDALTRCDMPAHRLVQARDELSDRLETGRTCPPQHEAAWITLLTRYEAVCDALDVPRARRRLSALEAGLYHLSATPLARSA